MSRLAALSPRERVLLMLVLPLILLAAGLRLGWEPLAQRRAALDAEIAGYRQVARAAAEAGVAPATPAADDGPLAARVTRSAEAAGLSLTRLEPEGERLRVAIEEAPFPQVILWLDDLEAAQGVVVAAVEMDRRTLPGAVSARLLLEGAP